MTILVADRVQEATETSGTGTYDLGGTLNGFQTFVAGIGTGNQCYYAITDDIDWEVGYGTVTDAATDTLSRDAILASSNSGLPVDWGTGQKFIWCDSPAAIFSTFAALSGSSAQDFATKALSVTGNITVTGTVDGRDIAADGTTLDGAVLNADTSTAAMSFVIDEDTMASDSNTKVPTQQSVKAYVDSSVSASISEIAEPTAHLPLIRTLDVVKGSGTVTFARAVACYGWNRNTGLLDSIGSGTERYNRDSDGKWKLLVEETSANAVSATNWRTAAMWTAVASATITANQTGIDGGSNKACTIEDTSAAANQYARKSIAHSADTQKKPWKVYVLKGSATNTFVRVRSYIGAVYKNIQFNCDTGEVSTVVADTGLYVSSKGDWWEVGGYGTGNGSATTGYIDVFPAFASTLDSTSQDVTAMGSVVADWPQLEEIDVGKPTSPMAGGGSRTAADAAYITNANLPYLPDGGAIMCTSSSADDGAAHTYFSAISGTGDTYLQRGTTGVLEGKLGGVAFTSTYTPDESAHKYTLKTDGTTHLVYEDATQVHSFTGALTMPTGNLYIGSYNGASNFANAGVGNLKIFDYGLSANEIATA